MKKMNNWILKPLTEAETACIEKIGYLSYKVVE